MTRLLLEPRRARCYKGCVRRLAIVLVLALLGGVLFDGRHAACNCPPSCADEQQQHSRAADGDCLKACCASPRFPLPLTVVDLPALAPIATVLPTATVTLLTPVADEILHVPKPTA